MTRKILASSALATILAVTVPAANAANLTVVHGITGDSIGLDPSLPVDISLDGGCAIENAVFGDVIDAGFVDAGQYAVEIRVADALAPCSGALAIATTVSISLDENAAVVAHLTDDGSITATKFSDDLRAPAAGAGRIIARHTADAPAVDVVTAPRGGVPSRTFTDLENPDQGKADVPAGGYAVAVTAAGDNVPVLGPLALGVAHETVNVIYVVGSLAGGNLTAIVSTVPSAP